MNFKTGRIQALNYLSYLSFIVPITNKQINMFRQTETLCIHTRENSKLQFCHVNVRINALYKSLIDYKCC